MRKHGGVIGVLATGLLAVAALAWAADPLPGGKGGADKVRTLQQEKVTTLKQLHELLQQAAKAGQGSLAQVHRARVLLLDAQLDLAEDGAERVKLLEAAVKHAEEWENVVAKMVRANEVPRTDLLRATVERLTAQVALEKERAKAGEKKVDKS